MISANKANVKLPISFMLRCCQRFPIPRRAAFIAIDSIFQFCDAINFHDIAVWKFHAQAERNAE